jgi:hypothetical protein
MMIVRNLILGEELPSELVTGYEQGQCDPKWIWVAEYNEKVVGILVTAPAHIAVILLRLVMAEGAPSHAAGELLSHSFMEMALRGYNGFIVWLDEKGKTESQLLRLVEAIGGGVLEKSMSLCYGRFNKAKAEAA